MNLRKIAVAAFVSTTLLVVAQAGISEGNFVRQGKELGRMPKVVIANRAPALKVFNLMPPVRILNLMPRFRVLMLND